jgi:hypothetical protein
MRLNYMTFDVNIYYIRISYQLSNNSKIIYIIKNLNLLYKFIIFTFSIII